MADEFYAKPPFTLNEGEKIVTSIKPIWKGYFLRYSLGHMIFAAIIGIWIGVYALRFGVGWFAAVFLGLFAAITLLSVAMAKISYGKFTVWLTDHRVVSAKGTIGYNIESMPLENIVDVVVSRGILDRILGLSSVMPVPMGGMVMYGRRSGLSTVGFIPALHPDDALKIQKELFDLRNLRKKDLKE
ncbi:MAG: PH domain-containing protein [Candidatus Micrarchaeota archaeon]|nr:PH domain-containing protein [Candidatus Micrarchaeota archaeon]